MALYWPEQKVALEIVDDPASQLVDRDTFPDFTVIQVTCEQIEDPVASHEIACTLAHHMGTELPPTTRNGAPAVEPSIERSSEPLRRRAVNDETPFDIAFTSVLQ